MIIKNMKTITALWMIAALIGILESPANAQESNITSGPGTLKVTQPEATSRGTARERTNWNVDYMYGSISYSEPGLMRDSGSMNGFAAAYTFTFADNPTLFRIEGEYMYGYLSYDGSTWDGTPISSPTQDNLANVRALMGFQGLISSHFNLIPIFGLGARYLNDYTQGAGGYEREITYFYAPVGLSARVAINDRWKASVSGEYDTFISGTVVSHLGDSNPAYSTVTNNQSSGYGYRVAMGLERSFDTWSLRAQPYVQYWNIQQSDIQPLTKTQVVYEPTNDSTMYGFDIALIF
jgi:hypothetical protein